mmetsp:Transcript_32224/g.82475  ORF Transcript_32224/g.82475 Transcript_32224/m.82475 type:complete len:207 (-) Transcript_32224:99-719(-)|eukprot:jgi/Tetstr1/462517/TSEL_007506.t1
MAAGLTASASGRALHRSSPCSVPRRSWASSFAVPDAVSRRQARTAVITQASKKQPKKNKRGVVSTRPGTPSRKESQRRAEEMKNLYPEEEAEEVAMPSKEEDEIIETPTEITDNMLQRIIIFSGLPVFTGFLMFPMFYYLKVAKGIDLPTWVVYIATGLAFGGGLAGISYGVLSASWDPRRKGSALGLTEFQANLPILMDSLNRRN